MADDAQVGWLDGIDELAAVNRGPPVAARLALRLPGPGRLAGRGGAKLKEVLDPAFQGGGQCQCGGGGRHQAVGLDRTDPGPRDPRPDCQIVLRPSPGDATRSYSVAERLLKGHATTPGLGPRSRNYTAFLSFRQRSMSAAAALASPSRFNTVARLQ